MKNRYCDICGEDISDRPEHHYLCYSCWKRENRHHFEFEDDYKPSRSTMYYNQTYAERYKGDSEYDMGPNWDYDEYPPENL